MFSDQYTNFLRIDLEHQKIPFTLAGMPLRFIHPFHETYIWMNFPNHRTIFQGSLPLMNTRFYHGPIEALTLALTGYKIMREGEKKDFERRRKNAGGFVLMDSPELQIDSIEARIRLDTPKEIDKKRLEALLDMFADSENTKADITFS